MPNLNVRRLTELGMSPPLAQEISSQIDTTASPITSVNGKTGVVTLAASDVGAAADDVLDGESPVTVTFTTGDPEYTPTGALTIADGAEPTVDELLKFCLELNAKIEAIQDALGA